MGMKQNSISYEVGFGIKSTIRYDANHEIALLCLMNWETLINYPMIICKIIFLIFINTILLKSQQTLFIKWKRSHWGFSPCSKDDYLWIGFKMFQSCLGTFVDPLVATLGAMSWILLKYTTHTCFVCMKLMFILKEKSDPHRNLKFLL